MAEGVICLSVPNTWLYGHSYLRWLALLLIPVSWLIRVSAWTCRIWITVNVIPTLGDKSSFRAKDLEVLTFKYMKLSKPWINIVNVDYSLT